MIIAALVFVVGWTHVLRYKVDNIIIAFLLYFIQVNIITIQKVDPLTKKLTQYW